MVNENFTAQQWIDYFLDKIEKDDSFTVNDLREAVKTISVHDPVAGEGALTVLYSGEGDAFPKALADKAGSGIRMIDRTEASKFLTHKDFYKIFKNAVEFEYEGAAEDSELFSELERKFLYDGSSGSVAEGSWRASEGFWSIVSRRFASETSGDSYALVSNALPNRIFGTDELKTLLETLPDGAKICGFNTARGVVVAA